MLHTEWCKLKLSYFGANLCEHPYFRIKSAKDDLGKVGLLPTLANVNLASSFQNRNVHTDLHQNNEIGFN